MNTKSHRIVSIHSRLQTGLPIWFCFLLAFAGLSLPNQVQGASQIWTNAPVDATWTNINNWVSRGVPGALNLTGNTVNNDIATFTNPVSSFGGAAFPILIDDGTVAGARSRNIGGITFDTADCGAFVFSALSAPTLATADAPELGILNVSHNNFIQMSALVTNSQTFIVPLFTRLPASTAGVFTFLNNAASSNAIMYIAAATNDSANTRGTVWTLDGTNTGTNTVGALSAGTTTTGANGFTKQGTGTWILAGGNDFRASTVVNIIGGLLIVKDPGAFNASGVPAVTNSTLQIDNISLTTASFSLRNGGIIRMNGSGTVNGINVQNVTGNNATLATTSPTDVLTIGNNANTFTGGAVDSVVHISGPGTVLFSQGANYAGRISVDSGTNQISTGGALGTGPNLNVSAGGVFDITPMGGTTYTLDTKAFSANGTGTTVGSTAATVMADAAGTIDFISRPITLTFTPTSFTGDSGHPALYCSHGYLAFHGNAITVNNASGTPLGAGTYQLVSQAVGNISSSGAFVTIVTGSGLGAGLIGEITTSGGNLNLVVTAYTPKSLVWTGSDPLTPGIWDRQISTNWLAGATPSTFNIYDSVTFNATGAAQPNVTLAATMVPSSVLVDTTGNDYTFGTSSDGQIAGGTELFKKGPGTLFLNTANTYTGGTLTTNGTIKLGIDNALSGTGSGDVTNISPAVIDLNGFANSIGALNGNGTVDVTSGGTSTLTIGDNDNSGTFSGLLANTSGTLNITKIGLGSETLTRSNSYVGTTDLEQGTLKVTDPNALGNGASALVINAGVFDLATNVTANTLSGSGGAILNQSTTTTNILTLLGPGAGVNSYGGAINSGAGKIGLRILGGTLRLTAANTFSNGIWVGGNATFQIHNNPASVVSPIIASNNATLGLSGGGSAPPATGTSVTTVDGATVTFNSGAEGDIWTGPFIGSATTTNNFTSPQSAGGNTSFSNFLGLVKINLTTSSQNFRFFNGGGLSGGDNTTFEFDSGNVHTRDSQSVTLGSVVGGGTLSGIGGPATAGAITTWIIGAKNQNDVFSGYFSGSCGLVKAGTGTLVLNGDNMTTNTDSSTYTNYTHTAVISYTNNTTISNGVLTVVVPNDLSFSPVITLAAPAAILDASSMGYVSNYNDDFGANAILVTNGTMTLVSLTANSLPQSLGGLGSVKCSALTNNGVINPGLAGLGGTLTISNYLTVNAGASNNFDLSGDPSGVTRSSDMLAVKGSVNLFGASTIGISGLNGVLNVGAYPLIKYTGSLFSEGALVPPGSVPNFSLGGAYPPVTRASLLITNTGAEVDLIVASLNTTNLYWQGDGISNWWDVVNTYNWTNNQNAALQFYQQDNVFFNSTSTNGLVVLQGTVVPTSITVSGATNYVFAGPGNIGGDAVLTMNGATTLLITNGANSFAGGTVINSGVVRLGGESGGNQNDLALGSGPITVNSGAELRFGGNGGAVVNHFITNTITVNGGVVKAYDGVQQLTNSTVTVGASGGAFLTVFSTKNIVIGSPLGGTGTFTVASGTNAAAGQVVLLNISNNLSGATIITNFGNLLLANQAGLSNSASIDVQTGGILDITARTNSAWSLGSGQLLKGGGSIRGRFITALAGSTVSPGVSGAIGALTVTNQGGATTFALVTLGGTTSMDINRSGFAADLIRNVNGTNVMGGTLTVNNIGAALQANDSFQLFVGATNTGAFTVTNLPALGSGLAWSNSLALNGRITVIATTVIPTNSPTITGFSLLSGTNIVISGTNGQAGGTYYLITTTNIARPFGQWRTVATSVMSSANFTLTGTNVVNQALGQQFYSLSSTNVNP